PRARRLTQTLPPVETGGSRRPIRWLGQTRDDCFRDRRFVLPRGGIGVIQSRYRVMNASRTTFADAAAGFFVPVGWILIVWGPLARPVKLAAYFQSRVGVYRSSVAMG